MLVDGYVCAGVFVGCETRREEDGTHVTWKPRVSNWNGQGSRVGTMMKKDEGRRINEIGSDKTKMKPNALYANFQK